MAPLASIPVGVVVERSKSTNHWVEFLWRPLSVLTGVPDTPVWSQLTDDGERATFYIGAGEIELHRTETGNYRDNLTTGAPLLWVVLRPTGADPPYQLGMVTADPAEGEALAGLGSVDIIETVPMPPAIEEAVAAFVAKYHVERTFVKRKRDRADPEKLARRVPHSDDKKR
jgi:hypothetical protein